MSFSTAPLYRMVDSPEQIDFTKLQDDRGTYVVPVVCVAEVGSALDGVLMVGFADKRALGMTLNTRYATFWSRSRRELWTKGQTNGNYLKVSKIITDCDGDTLLYIVQGDGPACHTLASSCFQYPTAE